MSTKRLFGNYVYPAQNAALTGINDASTFLTVMNCADLTRSAQGAGLAFFHIESGRAVTGTDIIRDFDAPDSNDDAAPLERRRYPLRRRLISRRASWGIFYVIRPFHTMLSGALRAGSWRYAKRCRI